MTASQDVGGLRFVTDGTFASTGTMSATKSAVQIGFVPKANATFHALLNVAGGVDIETAVSAQKFVSHGGLGVIAGAAVRTIAAGQQTFKLSDLLGGGSAVAAASSVAVGAESFLADKLKLVDDAAGSIARLGGQLDFAALGNGFTLDDATSFITAGVGDALKATLANGLSLRGDFTVGGTSFKGSVKVQNYDSSTDSLGLSGTSAFNLGKNTFDITVGTDAAAGLSVQHGKLGAFAFSTSSAFALGSAKFTTTGLHATYDAAKSDFALKGSASVALGENNKLSVELGGKTTGGLVVASGKLVSLDFVATGAISVGGSALKLDALAGTYVESTDVFTLNGTAALTLGSQSVGVNFGASKTAGLIVTQGNITAAGGVITADLSVGNATFKSTGLTTNYTAVNRTIAVTGAANLAVGGTTLAVKLGSTADEGAVSHGLLVQDGKIAALDAAVTGTLSVGGATFKAESLHVVYASIDSTYKVDGKASLALKIGEKTSNLNAAFGTAAKPGLILAGGSVQSFDFTADGNIAVGSVNVATKGLSITRDGTGGLTATGNASIAIEKTTLDLKLGSTAAEGAVSKGLVIRDGSLQSLDAAITGGFSVSSVAFKADALHVAYVSADTDLAIDGKATLSFKVGEKASSLATTFGTVAKPGLVIANGAFQKLDITADGNLAVGGANLAAKALHITRDAAGELIATGMATLTVGDSALEAKLGSTAADGAVSKGLVIRDGALASLDASLTGGFSVSSVTFKADALHLVYVAAASDFAIDGKATLSFKAGGKDSSLATTFGTAAKPGLTIANGAFQNLDVTANGPLNIGSLALTATSLNFTRLAGGDITAKGTLVATVGEAKIEVALGQKDSAGLIIHNGELKTLDAAVTSDFTLGSVKFTTKTLRFVYTNADGKGAFAVTGDAAVAVGDTTLALTLGSKAGAESAASQGLLIQDGKLASLDAAVTGGFNVGSTSFKADALHLVYASVDSTYKIDGKAALNFKIGEKASSLATTFGTAAKPGLIIANGKVATLDITADGNLAIGSVNLAAKALHVTRDAAGALTATGAATLTVGDSPLEAKLGSTAADGAVSKGLVIRDGALASLDASLTGGFSVSSVTFKADALHLVYVAAASDFAVDGKATLSFKTGDKTSSLSATFGTALAPGLIIAGGTFQKLDITADGELNIGSVAITAKSVNFTRVANGDITAKGMLSVRAGEAKLDVALGQKDSAGLVIHNGELKTLDAAVTSDFSLGGVKISTKSLRFAYTTGDGQTAYEITGDASATFKAAGKDSTVAVGFGLPGTSGLRIVNGKIEDATLKIGGEVSLGGVSIKADDLTMAYKASLSRFVMYGGLELSTAGGKVLDRLKATLGKSFDAPGIEIDNGQLTRLEIGLDGNVKLGPLTATANHLRVQYVRVDEQVKITGGVMLEIAGGKLAAAFPATGLRINTNTGDVQLDGLSLKAGGIKVGSFEFKDVHLDYLNSGDGNARYAGGAFMVVDGREYGASFSTSFVNHEFSSFALAVTGRINVGKLTITKFNAGISGLQTGGSLEIMGGVTAVLPGGKGKDLLTIDGKIFVNSQMFKLEGDAVLFDRSLLEGQATIIVNYNTGTLDFNGNMKGLGGSIEGNAKLKLSLTTGYFDASAGLTLKVPDKVPLVGGTNIGNANVHIKYGPETTYRTQAVLPIVLRGVGLNDNRTNVVAGNQLTKGSGGVIFSPDYSYKLTLQDDGNLVFYNTLTNTPIFASGKRGDRAVMQSDGNFVLYSGDKAVWATDTSGNDGARLAVQNDGNLVIYATDGRAIYSSKTNNDTNYRLVAMVARIAAETDSGTRNNMIRDAVNSRRFGSLSESKLAEYVAGTQAKRTAVTDSTFFTLNGSASVFGLGGSISYVANLDTGVYKAVAGYNVGFSSGTVDIASNGDPRSLPEIVIVNSLDATPLAASQVSAFSVRSLARIATVAAGPTNLGVYDSSVIAADLLAMSSTARKPTATMGGVSFDASKDSATVKYTVSSASPASVSVFVDTDAIGHDGIEIDGGLVAKSGVQSLTYDDLAAALPADAAGAKLYFYVEVDDGIHGPIYSAYSNGLATQNLMPTISAPTATQHASVGSPLTFAELFGNPIHIRDPLVGLRGQNSAEKTSLTVEIESNGEGILTVHDRPGVTVEGNGTEWLTLTGQSEAINYALHGLKYTATTGAMSDDLVIEVRRTDSMLPEHFATQTIPIAINELLVAGADDLVVKANGSFQKVLPRVYVSDAYSDSVTPISVAIEGYQRGIDLLRLDPTGLDREVLEGLSTRFDAVNGVLTFTGGATTAGTATLLLRHLQYASTRPTGKRLAVTLLAGDVENSQTVVRIQV